MSGIFDLKKHQGSNAEVKIRNRVDDYFSVYLITTVEDNVP